MLLPPPLPLLREEEAASENKGLKNVWGRMSDISFIRAGRVVVDEGGGSTYEEERESEREKASL